MTKVREHILRLRMDNTDDELADAIEEALDFFEDYEELHSGLIADLQNAAPEYFGDPRRALDKLLDKVDNLKEIEDLLEVHVDVASDVEQMHDMLTSSVLALKERGLIEDGENLLGAIKRLPFDL
jgi:hypothetical protein